MSDQRKRDRQHRGQFGAFHHRVVDRFLRRLRERDFGEAVEIEIGGELVDGVLGGVPDLRLEARKFAQHHLGAEHEVAAVPEIAVGDIARGGRRIGLLDEGFDLADRAPVLRRLRPDIAVARSGIGGLDAEGDDGARHRRRQRGAARSGELLGVGDEMVGGDHQQDGRGIVLHGELGGGGDGGRGIAALRLQDDGGLDAAGARLLGDDEAELGIGDDHRRGEQALARVTRSSTCWKVDDAPISGTNCFGIFSRDTGHRRVPAPPHNITGTTS